MSAYYNEHDKHAAAWLRELIKGGHIANGVVDERSIVDVKPADLAGFTQCHFFAGIGGWSLALRLAGWRDDRHVWSGSCPCQPFSDAGAGKGTADERHLWPVFFNLIRECGPRIIFGEQVASSLVVGKAGGDSQAEDGPVWLDGVFADLEAAGYTTGASVLGAHSVSAPHIRQRLYWLGHAASRGRGIVGDAAQPRSSGHADGASEHGRLADGIGAGLEGHAGHGDGGHEPRRIDAIEARPTATGGGALPATDRGLPGNTCRLGDTDGRHASAEREQCGGRQRLQPDGDERNGLANAECHAGRTNEPQRGSQGRATDGGASHWTDAYWLLCRDGKHRRVPTQSALFPLAPGLPYKLARRGSVRPALLKGAGNAIVPQVAAEFIRAFEELNQFSA